MKFGETLKTNQVKEWEEYYVNYAKLKVILKSFKKKMEGGDFFELLSNKLEIDSVEFENITDEVNPNKFYSLLLAEVNKIDSFYILKLQEVKADIDALGNQLEHLELLPEGKKKEISRGMIMNSAINCYRVVMMLDNFCNLNVLGLKKITKKYDRVTKSTQKEMWLREFSERTFYPHLELDRLKRTVESFYALKFCEGNKYNARTRLKARLHNDIDWNLLKIGMQLGVMVAFLLLLPSAIAGKSHTETADHPWSWESFIAIIPVFRLVLLPVIAIFMWGLNLTVFRHFRINWIFICEFHPLNSATPEKLMDIATSVAALFSVTLVLYILQEIHSIYIGIPSQWYPMILIFCVFLMVFWPFDRMYRSTRWTFLQILLSVMASPMGLVRFVDFFVGDVLTSMVKTFFDAEYTFCYYVTGDWINSSPTRCNEVNNVALPILSGLPLYWRLMQCLRRYRDTKMKSQLLNALKYTISLSVVLFSTLNGNLQGQHGWSPLRLTWLISFIIATLYSYTWDVLMDWGLFQKDSRYPGLRSNTMLPIPFYYYAIVSNFFLRFFWAITISPLPPDIGINPTLLTLIASILEVIRRFTWSIIRFENEYINNVGKFRKTNWVPLPFDVNKPKRVRPLVISEGPGTMAAPGGAMSLTSAMPITVERHSGDHLIGSPVCDTGEGDSEEENGHENGHENGREIGQEIGQVHPPPPIGLVWRSPHSIDGILSSGEIEALMEPSSHLINEVVLTDNEILHPHEHESEMPWYN